MIGLFLSGDFTKLEADATVGGILLVVAVVHRRHLADRGGQGVQLGAGYSRRLGLHVRWASPWWSPAAGGR